ncbi:MAG: CHAT domain-containing protein [Phormidesmis sp. CAN_BIN36]|nr:CHAT domain-containing protein [Phormidesmis sp. CAN_BIN36]
MKRILILTANPKNTDKLRLDEEVREIQAVLDQARVRDRFEIVTRWAVRVDDLQAILLDQQPQVVHFSGHGAGTPGLALENEAGQMQLVSTKALAGLFQLFQADVECVFLNACYSEAQAEAIHQHIDCVVGMNQAVGDQAAINFARGFYRSLCAGKSYEESFEFGRNAIDLKGIPEASTPVLKHRKRLRENPSPILPTPEPKSQEERMPSHQNRSVSIGGSMTGSVIQTGDRNTASVQFHQTTLPLAGSVDINAELKALRDLLAQMGSPDQRKIDNALADVEDELKKPQPDKTEVGQALERAFNYAQKAEGFSAAIEKLQPRMTKVVSWLGENWYKLLSVVRLGVGI